MSDVHLRVSKNKHNTSFSNAEMFGTNGGHAKSFNRQQSLNKTLSSGVKHNTSAVSSGTPVQGYSFSKERDKERKFE